MTRCWVVVPFGLGRLSLGEYSYSLLSVTEGVQFRVCESGDLTEVRVSGSVVLWIFATLPSCCLVARCRNFGAGMICVSGFSRNGAYHVFLSFFWVRSFPRRCNGEGFVATATSQRPPGLTCVAARWP
ncbi:hypothetical protein PHAMO_50027 [Magnetospirillum molischianum DSM 120]|uniref:Uncharacterized protein n=1 Tax=Magnetospirillum molischianum DSM 120 TaxID=1150626 RepID=H8FWZ4_MAGML|nr:hypothetical protein PHAMO_50027 [Magnetospirillum molischianum DSM 120]